MMLKRISRIVLALLLAGLVPACGTDSSSASSLPGFEIATPTGNETYVTSQGTVAVGGSQAWPLSAVTVTNEATGASGAATVHRSETSCPLCLFEGVSIEFSWSFSVALVPGDNVIRAIGVGTSGEVSSDTLTVRLSFSVLRAAATDGDSVDVWFSAPIEPGSVNPDGSQFSFIDGLTSLSAVVDGFRVTVGTTFQTTGTRYRVEVLDSVRDAALGLGVDPLADSAEFPGCSAPLAPADVFASPGDSMAVVSWLPANVSNAPDVTSWTLYRAVDPGLTRENYSSLAGGTRIPFVTSPYPDPGLVNGRTYYYVVAGSNAIGEGSDSVTVSATPSRGATSPITGPASSAGSSAVRLTGSLVNPAGYTTLVWFEYGATPDYGLATPGVPYSQSGSIAASADVATAPSLLLGSTYYYRIVTRNLTGTFSGQRMIYYDLWF